MKNNIKTTIADTNQKAVRFRGDNIAASTVAEKHTPAINTASTKKNPFSELKPAAALNDSYA